MRSPVFAGETARASAGGRGRMGEMSRDEDALAGAGGCGCRRIGSRWGAGLATLLFLALCACGGPGLVDPRGDPRVFGGDAGIGDVDLAVFLARHPMPPGAAVHAVELGRTASASHHLVQVRDAEPPHFHRTHDLTVTVLRGAGNVRVGERTVAVRAGDVVIIPRGVPHFFRNGGDGVAVALSVFTPPFDGADVVPIAP
jgi:mannose-6-phosphate isomerase-like protein (cupin superfamily)